MTSSLPRVVRLVFVFQLFPVHNFFVLSCRRERKMASAAPICTCIKTASNTPTCEECVKSLQLPIRDQHCRLKNASGKSVHNPHKGLCPHTLERAAVPRHACCGYFHLPSQCRFCHNGGHLLVGPKVLSTTCHNAIRQLAEPSDSDEDAEGIAADEDDLMPYERDLMPSERDLLPLDSEFTSVAQHSEV
jgi:hypothetical protein